MTALPSNERTGVGSVAVALAVHDGEPWLAEQVASIVGQTRPPDRMVVVDDASCDASTEVIDRCLEGTGIEVAVHRNTANAGVVSAFETAVGLARADVVLLCDQDDVWRADKIARLVAAMERPGVDLAFSDAVVADAALQPQRLLLAAHDRAVLGDPERLARAVLRRNVAPGMTMAMSRRLAAAFAPVPAGWNHDHWLLALAAWSGASAFVDEPLVTYRTHRRQTIGPSDTTRTRRRRRLAPGNLVRAFGGATTAVEARAARLTDVTVRLEERGLDASMAREHLALLRRVLDGSATRRDLRRLDRADIPVVVAGLRTRVRRRRPAGPADPPRVHFWSPAPVDLAGWDPDAEPDRFTDGRSHAMWELAARLDDWQPTLGPTIERDRDVVVVFAKDVTVGRAPLLARRIGCRPTVLVQSDRPLDWVVPYRATVRVLPHGSRCDRPDDVALPLLPQRGLRPRDPSRGDTVAVITYKGSAAQTPSFLTDPQVLEEFRAAGVELDEHGRGTEHDDWTDFGAVDVALCMRADGILLDDKPPTKVVNAWAAGCIPLVGPEPLSRSIVSDGVDALLVDDVDDVIGAVQRLGADPVLRSRLFAGVASRRESCSTAAVLGLWRALLEDTAAQRRQRTSVVAVRFAGAYTSSIAHALRRRLVRLRRSGVT